MTNEYETCVIPGMLRETFRILRNLFNLTAVIGEITGKYTNVNEGIMARKGDLNKYKRFEKC